MTNENFKTKLEVGRAGESVISRWLRKRGHSVLPVYEKIIDEGKGPQLFSAIPSDKDSLVAPDMVLFRREGGCYWIEAKTKTAFTYHRKTGRMTTGIDFRHYQEYLEVQEQTKTPIALFFLQMGGYAKDSPPSAPGLFWNWLHVLAECENHRHTNWGNSGMVYWAQEKLILAATLEELGLEPITQNPALLPTDWHTRNDKGEKVQSTHECPVCGLRRVMECAGKFRCTSCKRIYMPAEFALLARQMVKKGMEIAR